ncbi:hypothetical protein CASFOL_036435 [Castilleja foliolosa]|uniref:Uncharacterized protein n=1 Tax=Castilleja foliolosa TaxID=1961234 RepID=A0ABD3BVI8_9LAMI
MSQDVTENMLPLFRRYREQVLHSRAVSEMSEEEFIQCIPSPIPIKTHTFKFKEGPSSIDKYFDFNEPPVFDYELPDPIIDRVFWSEGIELMVNTILKDNQSNLFTIAEVCMGNFLNLAEKRVLTIRSACVESLLHGVWIRPLFRRALYEAIDSDYTLQSLIITYTTLDSVDKRTKRMKDDIYFSNPLKKLKDSTSKSTFLRFFLSILISYWADDHMLRILDLLEGKIIFTKRMDIRDEYKARTAKEEEEKLKLAGVEDMEPLKQLLDEKYGSCEDADIERLALKYETHGE